MELFQNKKTQSPFKFMDEITAVIVEDVLEDIDALKIILKADFPEVNIIGQAQSYASGIELIMRTRPMVAFMDIKLGGDLESFDVINEVYNQGFKRFIPIFITAYGSDTYQVRAIEYAGGQYFTKPIDSEKLKMMMQETFKQLLLDSFNYDLNAERVVQLIRQLKYGLLPIQDYIKNDLKEEVVVEMKRLRYLEADGSNTLLIFNKEEVICSKKTLKYFDDRYTKDYNFFRIHDQTLVNLDFMKSFSFKKKILTLTTGETLKVSQRYGGVLKKYLKDKGLDDGLSWWEKLF